MGEQKTKPTQSSVRDLRGLGLSPDFIACRSSVPLDDSIKSKISMFCHVSSECVLSIPDCPSVKHVPLLLDSQGLIKILSSRLSLHKITGINDNNCVMSPDSLASPSSIPSSVVEEAPLLKKWRDMTIRYERLHDSVTIVLVGKYTHLKDSYISVTKSLFHASLNCNLKLDLKWVEAADLEDSAKSEHPCKYHEAWQLLCSAQ